MSDKLRTDQIPCGWSFKKIKNKITFILKPFKEFNQMSIQNIAVLKVSYLVQTSVFTLAQVIANKNVLLLIKPIT